MKKALIILIVLNGNLLYPQVSVEDSLNSEVSAFINGSFFNAYSFEIKDFQSDESVILEAFSEQFEPVLILVNPEENIVFGGKFEGEGSIEIFKKVPGEYILFITSLTENETGDFVLKTSSDLKIEKKKINPYINKKLEALSFYLWPESNALHDRIDKYEQATEKDYDVILDIPDFPWPPPKSSASYRIPTSYLDAVADLSNLGDVSDRLIEVIEKCGYAEYSFFAVPNGFSIVTRIEKMKKNGDPETGSKRWDLNYSSLDSMSIINYFKILFTANPGYFRILLFVVTDVPFTQSRTMTEAEDEMEWLYKGSDKLTKDIKERSFTADYETTVLIYEFKRDENETEIITPGMFTGKYHMNKTGILNKLKK